jgi:Mg/Co/Ni transporter MgtE
MTTTQTDNSIDLDSDPADIQLASILRILEQKALEGAAPEDVVDMLLDFRIGLFGDALTVVDSDEVTNRIEYAMEEAGELIQNEVISSILEQMLHGKGLEGLFGIGFQEGR